MDNRIITVQSKGKKAFDLAFQLLFDNCPGSKATHYYEHPEKGFMLFWHATEKFEVLKLPFPMDWENSSALAWGWLMSQPEDKYQEYLDHDGSNSKGFKVYNEGWGHVAGCGYAFLAVQPIWAWHGK